MLKALAVYGTELFKAIDYYNSKSGICQSLKYEIRRINVPASVPCFGIIFCVFGRLRRTATPLR